MSNNVLPSSPLSTSQNLPPPVPSTPEAPPAGAINGRTVVLWKQILAASVITVLGAGILVGGSALVLHTPALRPKGGFIVLASACVGLLSMAGGIGWLGFASYASHFRSKALKYMREGEESYKGDRNKLYTICEACSRFFSKGELTPEEIALWRQARKHLQPFVAQDLQEFNGRSLFMQTVEVDRICELLALSGYDNNEDEAFQTFMKNFPHKVIQRGTN